MAGRPKGLPKTGGRQKGVPNRATATKAAEIAASGLTPLDYMLRVMRDGTIDHPIRLDAAKSAAPYVHPRLATFNPPTDGSGSLTITWKND